MSKLKMLTYWPELLSFVLGSVALMVQGDYVFLKKIVYHPVWYTEMGLPREHLLSISLALAAASFYVAMLPLVANKPAFSVRTITLIGLASAFVAALVVHHGVLLLSPWSFFFILCNVLWIAMTVVLPAIIVLKVISSGRKGY